MEHNKEQMAQVRAYLRKKMTKAQKVAFEMELSQNEELAQIFAEEKEMFLLFQGYEEVEMEKAMQKVQKIEINIRQKAFYKKLAIVTCILALILGGYWCYNYKYEQKIIPSPAIDTATQKKDTPPTSSKDSTLSSKEVVIDSKSTEKPKDAFADSLKNYQKLAQDFAKNQNSLIANLRRNVKLNVLLIDIADSLWECERTKENHFSMGKPKNKLQADTLVLDSIRKWQTIPALPDKVTQLKVNKDLLHFWKKQNARREQTARERYGKFREYYDYYKEEYRKCRE